MGFLDNVTTLTGKLVTLRPISREDYPTLFKWRSSFDVPHYLNFKRRVGTYEEFVRELEMMLPNAILLLVRKKSNSEPIGYALAHTINPWDGWAAGGVHVEERYRLRGHGGEAGLLFLDLLFRVYPLRKVMTEVYEFAESVIQTARSMGFEEMGLIPKHYWHEDRLWGVYNFVLTREAWQRTRDRFANIVQVQNDFARNDEGDIVASKPVLDERNAPATDGAMK